MHNYVQNVPFNDSHFLHHQDISYFDKLHFSHSNVNYLHIWTIIVIYKVLHCL